MIAVDQMNIRPGSLRPILEAAARFLDRLSPLDQVAFVAYPEPGPRVNFTNDKLRLKRAMQGLVGQQPRARPDSTTSAYPRRSTSKSGETRLSSRPSS